MERAKYLLEVESKAIGNIIAATGQALQRAVDMILSHRGKIMVCGIGKSGHIARKIAATFTSIGQPAVFLHPAEAVHGDLGVYSPKDLTILISKSGATDELLRLIPTLRAFNSKIIAIVGNPHSPIADSADVVIDISFAKEADPLGIVPTTSAIVSLAIGDALAAEIMYDRGVSKGDFARYHPAGQLGRNLLLRVGDVMAKVSHCARVSPGSTLREIVVEMTKFPLGAALVIGEEENLLGIITDGDIRRSLQLAIDIDTLNAENVMAKTPQTIFSDASLGDALEMMENRKSQISVLPVLDRADGKGQVVGLLRLHDAYRH
ncbi:MAG: KpsF/GutQ family sugar-phosphate isomerase [Puniceicoccales bacterium]|jgi:arabinose-5-phosphate isomerase|nr:KpsF/GutQ family sugar-phosphate isomerase [Puniceicoccales bacterium]